jgi:transcriptional regulator with XRE-family HTH domain
MIKEVVERLRHQRGWTKKEAAKRCDLDYTTFVQITLGTRAKLYPATIQKLAKGFDVDYSVFYEARKGESIDIERLQRELIGADEETITSVLKILNLKDEEISLIMELRRGRYTHAELAAIQTLLKKG